MSLSGQDTETASFTAPSEDTALTFTLTVTDQGNLTDTDQVVVTVQGLAPSVTTAAAVSAAENTTTVATLVATDADTPQANLVWSIPAGEAGGRDRAMFSLTSGGELSFKTAPDFETQADANTDGLYDVTVQVSDGARTATQNLQITVTDANEAPTAQAGNAQTVTHGAEVTLTGSGTDPDAGDTDDLTYSWAQTGGSPVVSLGGDDSATVSFTAPSEDTVLTFTLSVTDEGSLTATDQVVVTVTGLPPQVTTAAAQSVAENTTAVVNLAASDPDTAQGNLVWSIPSGEAGGSDRAMFSLTSGGELSFKTAPDFETQADANTDGIYEVTVQVSDGARTATKDLQITVTDAERSTHRPSRQRTDSHPRRRSDPDRQRHRS